MSPSRRVFPHVLLSALLALVATEASAYPADYVDIDAVFEWLGDGESVSGNFDITANNTEGDDFSILFGSGANVADTVGFDPASETVVGARVSFLFVDYYDSAPEVAVIDLGADALQEVVLSPQVYFLHLSSFEVDLAVIASLNETGALDWSITADSSALPSASGGSDFKVALARLEAIVDGKTPDAGPTTPEPASSALMAVGALLVARAGRKRSR
jgi:hypothetical protein